MCTISKENIRFIAFSPYLIPCEKKEFRNARENEIGEVQRQQCWQSTFVFCEANNVIFLLNLLIINTKV